MGTGTINSKRRYLNSLKNKHRKLDKEIDLLYSKYTNDDTVNQMKREKLNLKTQIANLEEQNYKMHRDYDTGASDSVTLFVGQEVEHTPVYKEQTLFVVGYDYDPAYLQMLCEQYNCNHVYLGANHSFDGNNLEAWTSVSKIDCSSKISMLH